jgi:DNA/RNA endonuclease YhcR with UshA esterase domain
MKFAFLLFVLSKKLKKAVKVKSAFLEHVKGKKHTVTIKTSDGSVGRAYIFSDGAVNSQKGSDVKSDMALVWQDATIGFSVMKSGKNEEVMKALSEGKLKIEGDGAVALWFSEALKRAMQ